MKITKQILKKIILEEIDSVLFEQLRPTTRPKQITKDMLIQLSTSWCPPCKKLKKMFEMSRISPKQWIYIDVENDKQKTNQYRKYIKQALPNGIKFIPVLIHVSKDGEAKKIDHNPLLSMSGDKFKEWIISKNIAIHAIPVADGEFNPTKIDEK